MEPKDKNVSVISLDAVEAKSKDVKPNLDLENTHCHICDIEVPKPFLAEHKQSLRHKTNVKIADIAINRMKESINHTDGKDSTDDGIDDSVHFCASCVTVMDIKDKSAHTKSLAHKNSLILQKIFDDFLILYHCDDSNDTYCDVKVPSNDHNIQGHINERVHGGNAEKTENRIANKKIIKENETKNNEGTDKYEYAEKNDDCEKHDVTKKIEKIENVENKGIEKYCGDDEKNEDTGESNRTEKKYEHFGKDEDAKKSDNCDKNEIIAKIEGNKIIEDIAKNESSEKNKATDKNGVNEKIESIEKNEVNEKNKDSAKMTIEFYHCKICDEKVPNNDSDIQKHVKADVHLRNAMATVNRILEMSTENEKLIIKQCYMEQTKNPYYLYCRVCKIQFQNYFILHLSEPQHKSNYYKLLKDNYLILKQDKFFCTVCYMDVDILSEIKHVYESEHKRILNQILQQNLRESILMEIKIAINPKQ